MEEYSHRGEIAQLEAGQERRAASSSPGRPARSPTTPHRTRRYSPPLGNCGTPLLVLLCSSPAPV
jgi:hypothetical protein